MGLRRRHLNSIFKYVRQKSSRKLFSEYSAYFYPAYCLHILDKYMKDDESVPKNKIIGERQINEMASKFAFIDMALTIMINLMLSQSLSKSE